MKGDEDAVVDCSVAWTTSGRLCNLSSDREDTIFVWDKSPNGITPLEGRPSETSNALEPP